MTGREAKTQNRIKEWSEMIMARVNSGQTIRSWCAEEGVSIRRYYYWLRKARDYAAEVMSAVGAKSITEGFQEVVDQSTVETGAAALSVPEGWSVCVGAEPRKATVQALPIEIGKCRVMADADVDPELLLKVCKTLVALC